MSLTHTAMWSILLMWSMGILPSFP
jgi:hypothetical protein